MSYKAMLNEMFNLRGINYKTVINKRLKYAERNDCYEFWEDFFLCNDCRNDKNIIYLFTAEQLKIMHNWWVNKRSKGDVAQVENFRLSVQNCLNGFYEDPKEGVTENIRICYFDFVETPFKISEIKFEPVENEFNPNLANIIQYENEENEHDNFFGIDFDEAYNYKMGVINDSDDCKKNLSYLIGNNLKEKIEAKFRNKILKKKKWLIHYGNHYKCNEDIDYCTDFCKDNKKKCPFDMTTAVAKVYMTEDTNAEESISLTVTLDGSASLAPEGKITSYKWKCVNYDTKDGNIINTDNVVDSLNNRNGSIDNVSKEGKVNVTLKKTGEYKFELKVTDDKNVENTSEIIVIVAIEPEKLNQLTMSIKREKKENNRE